MKPVRTLILFFFVLLLIRCTFLTNSTYLPASGEETSISPELSKTQIFTLTAQTEITTPEIQSEQMTATPQAVLPRSLYFLSGDAVWVIRPNSPNSKKITPADCVVTKFDVWPADGRLAYATRNGELFSIIPGSPPDKVFQLKEEPGYPPQITGIDWSPEGDSLAFTVGFTSEGGYVFAEYPSYPSGLWKINVDTHEAAWIKSNQYLRSIEDNINEIEKFTDPVWSPDGKSILVSGYYWEWMNKVWFYPLEYSEDDRHMHSVTFSPAGDFESWRSASWLPDSSGLLLSGKTYATFSDLIWANRENAETKSLINGELANLYIFEAYAVPPESFLPGDVDGNQAGFNRFVFLADCPSCEENSSARIYEYKYLDGSMIGQTIGPEFLCTGKNDNGDKNYPRYIEWEPGFSRGVLICGVNEMYIIDMHQKIPQFIDLLPSLPVRPEGEIPTFRWGEK